MQLLKLRNKILVLMILMVTPFFCLTIFASDFRYGIAAGLGGTGITQDSTSDSGMTSNVQRSEGPLVISLNLDYQISDRFITSIEDSFGVKFAPYSNGISFIGVSGRWFYKSSPPTYINTTLNSTLLIKQMSPFTGLSFGVATANVERPGDIFPTTKGTGFYFGLKNGFDYQISPTAGIRPEIVYSFTLPPNYGPKTILTEFAIQCGLYFFL